MADEAAPQPIEVLLVDDNEDDLVLLRQSLEDAPPLKLLHVVRDGDEALEYLQQRGVHAQAARPGLILLDIDMPRKSGFEVLSAMKSDPALRTIPVVMLTSSTRDEDIVRSYGAGACSFVSKPVSFEKLKSVIDRLALYWSQVAVMPPPTIGRAAGR